MSEVSGYNYNPYLQEMREKELLKGEINAPANGTSGQQGQPGAGQGAPAGAAQGTPGQGAPQVGGAATFASNTAATPGTAVGGTQSPAPPPGVRAATTASVDTTQTAPTNGGSTTNSPAQSSGLEVDPSSGFNANVLNGNLAKISQNITNGNYPEAQAQWSSYMAQVADGAAGIDINALIQAVMRDAYQDNQQDLKYYAEKLQFFNNQKKAVRDQITQAHNYEATQPTGMNANSQLNPPFVAPAAVQDDYRGEQPALAGGTGTTSTVSTANGQTSGAAAAGTPQSAAPETNINQFANQKGGGGIDTSASTDDIKGKLPNGGNGFQLVTLKDGTTVAYSADQSTNGGLYVFDKKGNQEMHLWGDPHIDLGGGNNDAGHFLNTTGVVQLPDNSMLYINNKSGGATNAEVMDSIDVVSGNDHQRLGTNSTQTPDAASNFVPGNTYDSAMPFKFNVDPSTGTATLMTMQADPTTEATAGHLETATAGTFGLASTSNSKNYSTQGVSVGAATSGNSKIITTKNELDNYIQDLETQLSTIGDDAQLAQVDLQNMTQKQQQTLQTLSDLSKSFHDLSMSIIRKIGS